MPAHQQTPETNQPVYIDAGEPLETVPPANGNNLPEGKLGRSYSLGSNSDDDTVAKRTSPYPPIPGFIPYDQYQAPPPPKAANPGPVGLIGFALTTILLNLHNTGHYSMYSVIPAMGICIGGGAQLLVGLLEYTRGNTFAFIAFTSYGAFWLSLVCALMLPNASRTNGPPAIEPMDTYFLGVYLLIWGIFSFVMTLCTLRTNWALFTVFFTLLVLFFLLAIGNMANSPTLLKVAGYEGVVCGSTALYLAFAEILNEVYDTTILPIGPIKNFPPNSWRWSTVMKKLGLGATESSVEDGR